MSDTSSEWPKSAQAIGILCAGFGIFGALQMTAIFLQVMEHETGPSGTALILLYATLAQSYLMLIAGVFILKRLQLGRILGLIYGAMSVGTVLTAFVTVDGAIAREAAEVPGPAAGIASLLLPPHGLIVPCLTLWVLTRPHVAAAFRGGAPNEEE